MRKKMYAAAAALALCWSGYRVLRYPIHHSLMPMNLFVLPGRMLSVRSASAGNQMIRRMTFPEPDKGLHRRVIHVSDIRLTVYERPHHGPSPCLLYIHGGGSVGVLVMFDTDDKTAATDAFKVMGKDVAMQIAAMSPAYLDEASVPADVLAHEKEITKAQLAEDPKMAGKPEQVLAKIVDGKIVKYFKENCLLDQAFVKDGDMNVAKYVASVAKELGADIKVTGFIRYAKGEGLEKREDDFAAEVASMMK